MTTQREGLSAMRRLRRVVTSMAFASLALAAVPVTAGAARYAPSVIQVTAVYIAVGASESVGFQPTTAQPEGARTPTGYASVAATTLRTTNPGLASINIGCPGATSASALVIDRCSRSMSQLQRVVAVASQFPDVPFYISIDLGFNDLRPCREANFKLPGCVDGAIASVRANIATLVTKLRSSISNPLHFVGMTHDDPFVVSSLLGGQADIATASVAAVNQLNNTLTSTYSTLGIPVVDVASLFSTGNTTPVPYPPFGFVTMEQARVCDWTWMCAATPFGPNIHMNNAGYAVVADALVKALRVAGLR